MLAAFAATTRHIRLTTAVVVLSTVGPVRLTRQFGTLDQIAHGRAEITVGRGVFGMPRQVYDPWIAKGLLVGSPQQVIDGIMAHREVLGADRFVGQLDPGLPEDLADGSLELCLTEVLPVIETETRAPRDRETETES
ncbi:LLM class flavin-dependent oxidoreductase [Streptomyces canarius]